MKFQDMRSHPRPGSSKAASPAARPEPKIDIRRQRSLATRKKIIDAAVTLIATKGLKGATFDAIAKATKLSPTLPVFHFKNKKALFTELLRVLSALYTESWNGFVDAPGLDAKEKLERFIAHDIGFAGKHPKAVAVWFAFWGDRGGRELYRLVSRRVDEFYYAAMRDAVEKVKAEGEYSLVDSEAVASSIYLQTFGFWLLHSLGGGAAALAQVERSMAFLLATAFPRHFGDSRFKVR
jgi:TetR/AcrR family transcriptional repressor of bet genes